MVQRAKGMFQNTEVPREFQGWSMGANTEPPNECAHQFFERQVGTSGDSVAVICGDKRLTYVELNGRANQLARHLREMGVGPDTLVAVCVPRGVDLAVGILGILKAGGAWVPMDPRHPRERKQTVLESTKAQFLLTESSLLSDLPTSGIQTVVLDTAWAGISSRNPSNLDNVAVPSNLAYVMFTSGSTGRPKGVMVTHANLAQYVVAMREALMVSPTDIYLHTASIAFSSSVRQLFLPLVSGATSLVATVEQLRESLSLFEAIKIQNVTILDLVPSYWRTSIDALSRLDELTRVRLLKNKVRLIASASEALQSDLPRKWRQEFRHSAQLINMFGQTETTGIVMTYPIPADDPLELKIVPLGKPIANASTYLLDEQGRIVPTGNLGEIHIGGPGVARGYLNLQEATAERFLPNPFSSLSGDRLYKTGDLGRCRADGTIEFVGRVDDQVKIRGIRIEPAEVNSVLGEHSDIKDSVVIGRTDEDNDRRLVAYVVPHEGRSVGSGALRTYLGEKLPEYMIPSAFVSLETLPRLASGKIDRHALPAPNRVMPEASSLMVPPRTDMERQLLDLWRAALGIVSISIFDDFFALGGNSLSAMNLLNQVNEVFGERVSVASLFLAPTVLEFASLMEHQRQPVTTTSLLTQKAYSVPAVQMQDPSYLVELQRGEGQTAIFCFMFAGGFRGEFSTFAGLAPMIGRRHTFYGVIARGTDGQSNAHRSVEEMAAAYIQEIKTAQPQGPYFLVGECFSAPVAYETARQLLNQGDGVAMLAFLDARVPGTTMNRILGSRITARVRYGLAILRETSIYLRYRVIRDEVQVIKKTHGKDWLRHLFKRIGKNLSKKTSIHAVAWGKTQASGTSSTMSGSADRTSKQLHRASKNYGLAVRRYECRPYAGKITILASTEFLESNPTMGWRQVRDLEIHEIPGKHETYYRNNKQMVAGFLKEIIEKAEQEAGQAQTLNTSPRR